MGDMEYSNPMSPDKGADIFESPIAEESAQTVPRAHGSTPTRKGATTSATAGGTAAGRAFVQARFSDLGSARKLLTTYKTAQFVVIEDISLAITFRLIQFIILIYAVMMLLYWHEYNVLHTTRSINNQFAVMSPFTGNTEEFCSGAGISGSDYVRIL